MSKKKINIERMVEVYKSGSAKEAERLAFDILFEDIEEIIPKHRC